MLYCTKAAEEDNVAVSEVIPLLKRLNLEINSVSGTGVQLLKKSILQEIKRYFVTMYGVESRKEYADPRFKLAGFQMRQNAQVGKLMVMSEMKLAYSSSEVTEDGQDSSSPSSENQYGQKSNSVWDQVFEDSGTSEDEEDLEDALRIELQNYLKEKRSDITTDPLKFWKNNSSKYPHLAKLVRRYHCAPPGLAASERIFSTAKNILGSKRLSLIKT